MTTPQNGCLRSYEVRTVRIAASVMAGLLVVIAVVAFWRRHVGAFQTPLSMPDFLVIGLAIVGPTILLRSWWQRVTRSSPQPIPYAEVIWALYSPAISLLAIFVTISVPGTSPLGIAILGVCFVAGEMTVHRPQKQTARTKPSPPPTKTILPEPGSSEDQRLDAILKLLDAGPENQPPTADLSQESESPPEEHVSQQLTRCRTEEGHDCLRGWLRVAIPVGHRTQNVHLAFCPAFEHPPKIDVHQEGDAPQARIKIIQCLAYGAHLEVKLSHPSPADETLVLRFQAIA